MHLSNKAEISIKLFQAVSVFCFSFISGCATGYSRCRIRCMPYFIVKVTLPTGAFGFWVCGLCTSWFEYELTCFVSTAICGYSVVVILLSVYLIVEFWFGLILSVCGIKLVKCQKTSH